MSRRSKIARGQHNVTETAPRTSSTVFAGEVPAWTPPSLATTPPAGEGGRIVPRLEIASASPDGIDTEAEDNSAVTELEEEVERKKSYPASKQGGEGAAGAKLGAKLSGGTLRAAAQVVLLQKKTTETHMFKENLDFLNIEQSGSRAVGGQKPHNEKLYWTIESVDYLIPDSKQEESHQREYTPKMRSNRRLFVWVLYAIAATTTSIVILYTLSLCDLIQNERSYATKDLLKKNDLFMAWVVWTGSSMVLCLAACVLVLWQPAAASSGIPGAHFEIFVLAGLWASTKY